MSEDRSRIRREVEETRPKRWKRWIDEPGTVVVAKKKPRDWEKDRYEPPPGPAGEDIRDGS